MGSARFDCLAPQHIQFLKPNGDNSFAWDGSVTKVSLCVKYIFLRYLFEVKSFSCDLVNGTFIFTWYRMKLLFICVFIAMFLNHFRPMSLRLLVVGPRHCQCPHLKISNWEKPDRVCLWLYWSATSYHIFIIYSIIHCIKKLKFNFRSCSCTHFGCRMPKDCLWRGQYFV